MRTTAGVILAGGRSSRMGTSKACLEWHGSTLLRRVVGIVARAVDGPVVVVRAPGQELPSLPATVAVVDDARPGRGPLEGIAAGLTRVAREADLAYVSSGDVPLLHPEFVRRMVSAMAPGVDIAAPYVAGRRHPLAAAYRVSVLPDIERLLARDLLHASRLLDVCRTVLLDEAALRSEPALAAVDADLESLRNVNTPADYRRARMGPTPVVQARWGGPVASHGAPGGRDIRAATLANAAAALGAVLDETLVVTLNGDVVPPDPEAPLVTGDVLSFSRATPGG